MNGTGDGDGGKLQFTVGTASYAVTDGRLIYSSPNEVVEVPLDRVTYVRARTRDLPALPLLALGSVIAGGAVLAAPLAASYAALSAYGLPNLVAGGLLLAAGVGAAGTHLWTRYGPDTATVEIGGDEGPILTVPVPAESVEGGELEHLMEEIERRAGPSEDDSTERVEERVADLLAQELDPLDDRLDDLADEMDDLRDAVSRDITSLNNGLSADLDDASAEIRAEVEELDDRLTPRVDETAEDVDHLGDQVEQLDENTLEMLERVSDYVELLTETVRGDSPDFPNRSNNGDTAAKPEQRIRR